LFTHTPASHTFALPLHDALPISNVTTAAGPSCTAAVDPGTPAASDSCSSVTVTSSRSDAQPLGAPYPIGVTTITWTATDTSAHRSEEHTSELQSRENLVCRLLLE